jgi:oligoribonuclease
MANVFSENQAMTTPLLKKSEHNLVWLDCEMTGLDPLENRLIEIAIVITNPDLSIRVEGPVFALKASAAALKKMDKWNVSTHTKSGLLAKVQQSKTTAKMAEQPLIDFLKAYVPAGKAPMCGNTIGQDRRFLVRYMPKLEAYFHYRNLDVSTLKELAKRWKPEAYKSFKKKQRHTALADVHESIDELIHYREHMLRL